MNKIPEHLSVQFNRLPVFMLVTALVVSGCSGSSDPVASDNQQASVGVATDSTVPFSGEGGEGGVLNESQNAEVPTSEGMPNGAEANTEEPDAVSEVVVNDEPVSDEPVSDSELPNTSDPFVVDPLIQNRILVSFDISVPAYQSDELRLEVVWGEMTLIAGWVGDEFWAVSAEFPADTQERLTVTFYDNNGAIELASFSQWFRTGSNATEAFQISADQFGADQFDDDGDGVSNLDELITGTDPTAVEDSLLEIRDFFKASNVYGISVNESLESKLSEERPISASYQETIGSTRIIDNDIQIDSDGNGTVTSDDTWTCQFDRISGIRTHAGNAITWEATRAEHDCDFSLRASATTTVTVIDENTRTFVEQRESSRTGSFSNSWQARTDLVGQLIAGTSLCEPVSGTFYENFVSNGDNPRGRYITNVSKEADDPYWRVQVQRLDFGYVDGEFVERPVQPSEYFARELILGRNTSSENRGKFICDFVDI